jgi:hypothetical protein
VLRSGGADHIELSGLESKQKQRNLTMPPDYDKKIDFHALVQQDVEFKQLLVANGGQMDFQNPKHVLCVLDSVLLPILHHLVLQNSELRIITILSQVY